jgi:endogenous inhibitor of DNA gyrase (YacG/DUF329 family)
MGFLSGSGKVVKAISKTAWKAGTKSVKFAGKAAGKSTLWVVKKAAVDPAKNKILDWKLVKNAGSVREAIKNGNCGQCGKKMNTRNADFCSAKCSMEAYESWSDVRAERVNLHAKPKDNDPMNLYFPCGCNKKGLTHSGCAEYGFMEI